MQLTHALTIQLFDSAVFQEVQKDMLVRPLVAAANGLWFSNVFLYFFLSFIPNFYVTVVAEAGCCPVGLVVLCVCGGVLTRVRWGGDDTMIGG